MERLSLDDRRSPVASTSSTPATSPASSTHGTPKRSFLQNAKRTLSVSLPKLRSGSHDGGEKKAPSVKIKCKDLLAETVAHPSHRENTVLHALFDSFPNLPTLHAPSLPSFTPKKVTFTPPSLNLFCIHPDTLSDDEDESHHDPPPEEREVEDDPLKRLTGNVVVLGGYRGSILRDAKSGKRLWIPLRVGLGMRKSNLALGLTDEDEEHSRDSVVPGKMLMSIGGVIDLGKRLKDKLKNLDSGTSTPTSPDPSHPAPSPGLHFHNFGYDWRRRLELSSLELLEFLENLKKESAIRGEGPDGMGEGATVIAHSMGGLVTLHALARAPDPTVFRGIIFAGTPFHGCVNVLGPIKKGDSVLVNREICSPSVVFSMRSSFYFLPPTGLCFETPCGEPLPLDFFSVKTWSDHNLSPVSSGILEPDCPAKIINRRQSRKDAETANDLVGGGLEPNLGNAGLGTLVESQLEMDTTSSRSPTTSPRHSISMSPTNSPRHSISMSRSGSASKMEAGSGYTTPPSHSDELIASYLETTLSRVQKFHAEITSFYDPSKSHLYPPISILTSHSTPTVRGILTSSLSTIRTNTYDGLLYEKGDGIVSFDSASVLPGGWEACKRGVVESEFGHVSLLGDVESVRKCLEKIYPNGG